jgi:GNAT superfamily N-acetyltransferase
MDIKHISAFNDCYMMQQKDIERFADTLADGFSKYNMFEYICNGKYSHDKMKLFWTVSITTIADDAICIADSKDLNSVLIYVCPKSKEPNLLCYLKAGGLKMLFKLGLRSSIKLLRFDAEFKKLAQRHRTDSDGYLMAFATRLDKQGQHYGKPLIEALLRYLDASGEGCYLETFKAGNVGLYNYFQFELKEEVNLKLGGLTVFAMMRQSNKQS